MRTAKIVGAVIAGVVLWGLLWNVGTAASQSAVPEIANGEQITHVGVLVGYIIYSALLSVLVGWLAAIIVGPQPMPAVWALGLVNFAIGVFVQVSFWQLFPLWYHALFLGFVVPATVWGGRLRAARAGV